MSDEARGFRILNETGGVADSRVWLDGHEFTRGVQEVRYLHRAGYPPVVEVGLQAIQHTEVGGRARVIVTVSGVEFTWDDVDRLEGQMERLPWALDLAERLASILPPRGA